MPHAVRITADLPGQPPTPLAMRGACVLPDPSCAEVPIHDAGHAAPSDPLSLLTVSEIVQRLRVSKRTVRRWIAAGRLPVIRLGRAVRIRPADLAQVIASGLPE
jgi:excisionase family DNA binding protein